MEIIRNKCVMCHAPATHTADLLLEDSFNFKNGWSVDLKQKINFCEEHSKRTVPFLIVNSHKSGLCEQL